MDCHIVPWKNIKAKPAIIIWFVNRKHKIELLKQARKLKGTEVHLNEHLTLPDTHEKAKQNTNDMDKEL